jgi:3-hydroxyisobutyrate dehydrogenase-like beta-hydroxyacid dehydrogenase
MTEPANKIAWIGVGKMGLPMAALIVKAGSEQGAAGGGGDG